MNLKELNAFSYQYNLQREQNLKVQKQNEILKFRDKVNLENIMYISENLHILSYYENNWKIIQKIIYRSMFQVYFESIKIQ